MAPHELYEIEALEDGYLKVVLHGRNFMIRKNDAAQFAEALSLAAGCVRTVVTECEQIAANTNEPDLAADLAALADPHLTRDELLQATEQHHTEQVCSALGLPFESPDGHGTRRYTWYEVLDNVRGRTAMWGKLLRRAEQVDSQWLNELRGGKPQPVAADLRDHLGMLVRDTWITWARLQPDPKPSWLLPWEELTEPDREVDRLIGVRLYLAGLGQWAGQAADFDGILKGPTTDGPQTDECPIRLARGEL